MELAVAAIIHFMVSASGFGLYWRLRNRMLEVGIHNPLIIPFFILFATYGGWLIVMLTSIFWAWSGMATIGFVYLTLVAPPVMFALTIRLYKQRSLSRFHFI